MNLTNEEAQAAYDCIKGQLHADYAKSGLMSNSELDIAGAYGAWQQFNTVAYKSYTHGGRFVNNFANGVGADSYGEYEDGGAMPVGSVLAKDSFAVSGKGTVVAGPLFVMEKMPPGFNAQSEDWRYTLVMPNGHVVGTTNGEDSNAVAFCIDCHVYAERDSLMFIPDEFRTN